MMILAFGWIIASHVTADAVILMMHNIPNEHSTDGIPSGYDRAPFAQRYAEVIAEGVKGEEDPWKWASLGAVYGAYEGGYQKECPVGDGGKSLGNFQLQGVDVSIACDPAKSFRAWLSKAHAVICKDLPEDEALSALTSGNCDHARLKTSRRARVAEAALKSLWCWRN